MKKILLSTLLCAAIGSANAGRPLAVDDANVNDLGAGHVEAWFESYGGDRSFTIAPAYSPMKGLEVSAQIGRDQSNHSSMAGIGAKYQITRPKEYGCHTAATLSIGRGSGQNIMFANLIGTCQAGFADIHINGGLGRNTSTGDNIKILGLAIEKELSFATVHAEVQGIEHSGPLFQIGARRQLSKKWQIDATIGHQSGNTVFSLGTKYQF